MLAYRASLVQPACGHPVAKLRISSHRDLPAFFAKLLQCFVQFWGMLETIQPNRKSSDFWVGFIIVLCKPHHRVRILQQLVSVTAAWYSFIVLTCNQDVGLMDVLLDETQQISLRNMINARVYDWHLCKIYQRFRIKRRWP